MTAEVKKPRQYDSSHRAEQTRHKRSAVLRSALELVSANGYAPTSMANIAASAGVSVEFVYKQFHDKPGLAEQLLGFALAGDDEPIPVAMRAGIQAVIAEPDARKAITLYAAYVADINARAGALLVALAAAAALDSRLYSVWRRSEDGRLHGSTQAVDDFAGKAPLSVSAEVARDTVWALNSPELHRLFVRGRGWTAAEYTEWLAEALTAALLQSTQ